MRSPAEHQKNIRDRFRPKVLAASQQMRNSRFVYIKQLRQL